MHSPQRRFTLAITALGLWASLSHPVQAQGQIDSFSADALQTVVGGTVNFGVGWSVFGDQQTGGGSDLVEPTATEGYQEWLQNWYWIESHTPSTVALYAGSASTSVILSGPVGSGQTGQWGFSVSFTQTGLHQVEVAGDYSITHHRRYEAQLASRYCFNTGDPSTGAVYLQCDAWSYSYPFTEDTNILSGSFAPATLQVEVLAVPEPHGLLLGGVGLALLMGRWRRGDRPARASANGAGQAR